MGKKTVKMARVTKTHKVTVESEMEEGEIVDDLEYLSDISSEEEFLLRQRLECLENYNKVLERNKAKKSSLGKGNKLKRDVTLRFDVCEASTPEFEDSHTHGTYKHLRVQRYVKPNKLKRKKELPYVDENNAKRKKDSQKKKDSRKKKLGSKPIPESSDESEDEYKNKRKKLADAVIIHGGADKTSLSARLHKMIHWSEAHIHPIGYDKPDSIVSDNNINLIEALSPISSVHTDDPICVDVTDSVLKDKNTIYEPIEVSTDEDVKIVNGADSPNRNETREIKVDAKKCLVQTEIDSDDDLELLRQHALKSKTGKSLVPETNKTVHKLLSEDEDSDTAILRLICLKSALLKKAIENKQKQKLQRKLSQSSNLKDELLKDINLFSMEEVANNTDIESVDMDIGSDAEEKIKDCNVEIENKNDTRLHDSNKNDDLINCPINNVNSSAKEVELDDDEDLLRAKLLTSLNKNLPNLVNPEVSKTIDDVTPETAVKTVVAPEAKKFIIQLDESDSEGEHEATKNLTKMHMKLAEQIDFQQKLDMFLKSTRMEVEKLKLPHDTQDPPVPKKPNKFVAKAVNHLPKSEQIEYKNLVRRMAELEKMKQTRQATLTLLNQQKHAKDTLKPRNVTIDATKNDMIEEQIAKSRKTIAEESAKMLKLKEEATKLSQRYKIAATELRNISTAITLNKKQQKAVQFSLGKIRTQHQLLLKSSTTSLHSKVNGRIPHLSHLSNKALSENRLQKENNPRDDYKNPLVQKAVKISVVNDFADETAINNPTLSVQLDVASSKKVVKIPNSEAYTDNTDTNSNEIDMQQFEKDLIEKYENNNDKELRTEEEPTSDAQLLTVCDDGNKRYYLSVDDYESPLGALRITTWQADPNAILCPFEVGGQCKDPDCKYLHTPSQAL